MGSESAEHVLEILNIVTALVSFLSCLSLVLVILFVGIFGRKESSKHWIRLKSIAFNKLSFYIITFILISNVLQTLGPLLPSYSHSNSNPQISSTNDSFKLLCGPAAFFKVFGGLCTFTWMIITIFIVYKLLLSPHKFDRYYVSKIKKISHCVTWPFALIMAVIPITSYRITQMKNWCFYKTESHEKHLILEIFCYYIWLLLAWFVIIVIYLLIYIKHSNITVFSSIPTTKRLQYYPFVFLFCWSFEIIETAYTVFVPTDKHNPNTRFILLILHITMTNLYGFFNSILFIFVIYRYGSGNSTDGKSISTKNSKTQTQNKSKQTQNGKYGHKLSCQVRPHLPKDSIELSGETVSLAPISVLSPTNASNSDGGLVVVVDDSDMEPLKLTRSEYNEDDETMTELSSIGNIIVDDDERLLFDRDDRTQRSCSDLIQHATNAD